MKNTGKLLVLVGVLTLLFSFSSWSQQKRVYHDKVEYVKIERPIVKTINPAELKSENTAEIKRMMNSEVILDKLRHKRSVKRPAKKTGQPEVYFHK